MKIIKIAVLVVFLFLFSFQAYAIYDEDLQDSVDDNFLGGEAPTDDTNNFIGGEVSVPPDETLEEGAPQMTGEMAPDTENEAIQYDLLKEGGGE